MTKFNDVISRITRRHTQASLQHHTGDEKTDTLTPPHRNGTAHSGDAEEDDGNGQPHMKPCLTTFDLVSLGVGSCLGTGMYLTAGLVASTMAGPGGAVSILVSGLFSVLTGLCYAELAGLCPKTSGSAYMYAYITLGELAAFVIGWGLVVEYVIGTAAGAVALSETLSSLSGDFLEIVMEHGARAIGLPKLDLVAAAICLLLTLLLASGAEMSAKVNNALNISNMTVLVFFFVASLVLGTKQNWVIGGFFPFGINGIVRAIPTCYFAYIGFDTVAATGEEAQDPSRSIPRSILLSIVINCVAYVIVISCLTFCLPFYMLHHDTAMTDVFPQLNFAAGKYIVAIGAVSGEFAATFGSMFPLPRVLSAMASDGLVFRQLGKICPKRRTPVRATLLSGFVAMVMSTFFDLELLIELVLMGTLLAYVLVTFALLFMRYVKRDQDSDSHEPVSDSRHGSKSRGRKGETDPASAEPLLDKDSDSDDGLTLYRKRSSSPRNQPNMSRSSTGSVKQDTNLSSNSLKPEKNLQDSRRHLHRTHLSDQETKSKERTHIAERLKSNSSPSEFSGRLQPKHAKSHRSYFESSATSSSSSVRHPLLAESSSEEESREVDSLFKDHSKGVRQGKIQRPTVKRFERLIENPEYGGDLVASVRLLEKETQHEQKLNVRPDWLKSVTDFADKISDSPKRTILLLSSIYGVGIVLCWVVSAHWTSMADGSVLALGILGFLSAILLFLVAIVCFLREKPKGEEFRAPLVPALPVFVAMFNIHMMTSLSGITWLLFAVWMIFGLCIYFFYGMNHSSAGGHVTYELVSMTEVALNKEELSDPDDENESLVDD